MLFDTLYKGIKIYCRNFDVGNQYQTINEDPEWIIKNMKAHPEWNGARIHGTRRNKLRQMLKQVERYPVELNKEENLLLNLMQVII